MKKEKIRGWERERRGCWEVLPVGCWSRARGGARVERLFPVPENKEKRSREGRRVSKESRPRAGVEWPLKRLAVEPEPRKEEPRKEASTHGRITIL